DSPALGQCVGAARILDEPAAAQRLDPRTERQLLAFVGAAEEDAAARRLRLRDQLGQEPRLADAGFAADDGEHPVAGPGTLARARQDFELGGTSDQTGFVTKLVDGGRVAMARRRA